MFRPKISEITGPHTEVRRQVAQGRTCFCGHLPQVHILRHGSFKRCGGHWRGKKTGRRHRCDCKGYQPKTD